MKIYFIITRDPLSGLEWRMMLKTPSHLAGKLLSRSHHPFASRDEVLQEVTNIILLLQHKDTITIIDQVDCRTPDGNIKEEMQEVHSITTPKEPVIRKDFE